MTAFDLIVIGVVGASMLFAYVSGFVRVIASLAAWIIAFVVAIRFSEPVGAILPDFGSSPAARHIAAFALVMIAVLIVGGLLGMLVSRLVRAAGLGAVDRMLGALLGLARGVLIVVVLVLLAGLTTLPRQEWWQNALLGPPLTVAALSLRPWLPKAWAERLDYRTPERRPARPTTRAGV